jgi:site-specific recombinase XerD
MNELIASNNYHELVEAALMSVTNKHTYRAYSRWLHVFLLYHEMQGKPTITRTEIEGFLSWLISKDKSAQSANQALSAIKKLADALLDYQYIDETTAARIERTKGRKVRGRRTGTWLSERQAADLVNNPDRSLRGLRDRAVLAVAYGCGLRRIEIANLMFQHMKYVAPEKQWIFIVKGKHNRIREVGIGPPTKVHLDRWIDAAGLESGFIFPSMDNNSDELSDEPMHSNTVYAIIKRHSKSQGLNIAPHDLRRSFALNSHKKGKGAPIPQIQKELGHQHSSTTESYMNIAFDYENPCSNFLQF